MINVKMDKKLITFLIIISSIFIMGASCSDNYDRESINSEPPTPPSQAVGGGCGVAGNENSEIKYVQIAGVF